jgi:DNA-binding MarR family transcriptional regulator
MPGEPIGQIETALHSLAGCLKQARLHELLLDEADIDLDRAGLAVLYVLAAQDGSLRLTDLAELLRIDPPAVTRKAQQLERSGLVNRARDADDGRATRLQLTSRGQRTISQFLAARRAWLIQVLASWPEADRVELARLLRRLAGDMHQHLGSLPSGGDTYVG